MPTATTERYIDGLLPDERAARMVRALHPARQSVLSPLNTQKKNIGRILPPPAIGGGGGGGCERIPLNHCW